MQSGRIGVLFNSMPIEFREGSVLVEVEGSIRQIPNDFVWIFAGGIPPSDFLKAANVAFGEVNQTVGGKPPMIAGVA